MNFGVFLLFCSFFLLSNGYKILFLAPFNGNSHWMLMQSMIEALLDRGHEVTSITSISFNGPKPDNYTEVLIYPPMNMSAHKTQDDFFKSSTESPFGKVTGMTDFFERSADYALTSENVHRFIHSLEDIQFDLVINEEFFHDSFLMFAHKFNAPLITISTYGTSDFFDRQFGLLTPWSHVPHTVLSYSDNMSFFQRVYNVALSSVEWIMRRLSHLPKQMEVAKKHFYLYEPLPTLDQLHKNVSVIMVYTHRSILLPRPAMPGIINIGGAHLKTPEPLPDDIQQFLDGADDGAIFMSLGTVLDSSKMSKDKLNIFLDAFKQLNQRVIWKFEDESESHTFPPNVLTRYWWPQNDILAHEKVVLFITHGGMFSTFEAISHGVPMLVIPFFGDQHRNAMRVASSGYGKMLNFNEMTSKSLYSAIRDLTTNESYAARAKEVSAIQNDNLADPMDEAMFWIEYVCRHRGAKHLKSHAVNMSWFSYLLLDIVLVMLLIIALNVFLVYLLVRRLCCRKGRYDVYKSNKM